MKNEDCVTEFEDNKFWGIDNTFIPRIIIPYAYELTDLNILENTSNKVILYCQHADSFILITDDPCRTFLSEKDIHSQWTKSNKSNLQYCIDNALTSVK